ncbi:MAG: hypothetical protein H6719_30275 [Sandaracinaceae bacterium]|nr:hypothetical protein [Sandaracinaceae bacterium]
MANREPASRRVSGTARLELADGAQLAVDLAGVRFLFAFTWEPSIDVIDVYEASLSVAGEPVTLELLESDGAFGPTSSVRVRPSCPSGARIVETTPLAPLDASAPMPEAPIVPVASRSPEERAAAYRDACEALATDARAAAAAEPARREELVLAAVERMAALARPAGAAHLEIARRLFFDTGYYATETMPLPDGTRAAHLVAVMLTLGDGLRGVDVIGDDGRRHSYRARPGELEAVDALGIARIDVRTQFSTRGPGGTRPGVVYDRSRGGFVFDGPAAARDAFRAAIRAALSASGG